MNRPTGVCPVCEGTGKIALTEEDLKYSWNKGKTHRACHNCGGQTMSGVATGEVPLRKDTGEPCVHQYDIRTPYRCYHEYTCKHCGYFFVIDSGD